MSFWSFRPLLVFWAAVLSLLAGTAIALQLMGPIRDGRSVHAGAQSSTIMGDAGKTTPVDKAAPKLAHVVPSTANPAPALPMTTAAIPDPDPAFLEPSGFAGRMLPRVSGARAPAQLYAAAFDPAERHPRVALLIDGAGLDRAMTARLMSTLPSAIDVAFSAYAPHDTAEALAQSARRQGRECLISIPMEPSGYPAMEEGTRALLTGAAVEANRHNLDWSLSGVAGCVGATGASDGLAGERYAGSTQAMTDLLATVDRRGLIYLDPRPGAVLPADPDAPRHQQVLVADVAVDRSPEPGEPADAQAIDRNLAELEQAAARHGSAIGIAGPPWPVLLDRIAIWSHGLAARGIVLAPLTAMPVGPRGAAP